MFGNVSQCVLSAMPHLGQWLGVTSIIMGIVFACCIVLVIGFEVILLVCVIAVVVSVLVCGVAVIEFMVIAVTVVIGVVGRVMIVAVFSLVVCYNGVVVGSNVISIVTVIVCGISCWWVHIIDGARRKGAGQKKKGQFIV